MNFGIQVYKTNMQRNIKVFRFSRFRFAYFLYEYFNFIQDVDNMTSNIRLNDREMGKEKREKGNGEMLK